MGCPLNCGDQYYLPPAQAEGGNVSEGYDYVSYVEEEAPSIISPENMKYLILGLLAIGLGYATFKAFKWK